MATAGSVNRTLLQSFYQNAGDVYDDTKTESAFGTLADQIDANYDYASGLVAGGVLQPYPFAMNRQAIINGNFDVWQRGTNFNSAVNGTYTSDRFKIGTNLGDNNVRVLRSTVVPDGISKFSCRLEGYGGVGGAGASTTFVQEIEDFSFFAGKQVTFSGYVKCDAGVAVAPLIFDGVNTVTGTTIISTSWTRFSLTMTLVSVPTSLRIFLLLNRSSLGVGAGINFTQLQLNVGSVALPFQPKSFSDELQQCLRYYEKSYNYSDAPGTASFNGASAYPSYQANGANRLGVLYKVAKRIAGTVTIYNPATGASGQMTNGGSPITAAATDTGNAGFATFPSGTYAANNDIRFHYVADAEI